MFENFMAVLPTEDLDMLAVLANFVSPSIFQHVEEHNYGLSHSNQNTSVSPH